MARRRNANSEKVRKARAHQTLLLEEARVRGLAALNRVRRGQSRDLAHAARAEGTTVKSVRRLFSGALIQGRKGGKIRVKAGDSYSARVEIVTNRGPQHVTARGSHEREVAGRHRATVIRVLQGQEPKSALRKFRSATVGGQRLITNFKLLSRLAQAGVIGQLDSLYVSPEASA